MPKQVGGKEIIMKKIIALILALGTLAFAGCGTSNNNSGNTDSANDTKTESDYEYVKEKGSLKIGITLFSPMDYYDDSNELTGFEVEFGKAVCEKLGVEPEFIEINWDSKEMELSSKSIDCIWNGLTITPERKESMSVSNTYMKNEQALIVKKENADKFKESIKDAKVVAEQGSAGEELATSDEEFFKDTAFTPVDSQAKALMEIESGISDVAVVDYVMSIGSIGEGTDYSDLVVVDGKKFSPEEYGIAFRKGSDITEKVNEIIKELTADGTLEEIATKYKLEASLIK